ncbi:dTDP-4-dehydrorhamnose reductase [Bacillus niameyensis]|uniref:dTDP-4-dehydrorhamnose reductase n=1 Tax=Bacillus niameyensis TaxID=1522308 RepID=UPI0007837A51|nr:dTDP-4-dehydrorhamnose reductase [Bacillus niameyensis]
MKILITGANGQLGKDLLSVFQNDFNVIAFTKEELNITNERKVNEIISEKKPNLIINAAAYTAVDDCETNRKLAFEVNSFGAYYLAKAAKSIDADIIQISTDYIFNGKTCKPYEVDDTPDPLSVYGQSKLLGEQLVQLASEKYYIVRTSWLYGHHGKNFVKTMLQLGKEEKKVTVVEDQVGSPTFTKDLAQAIKQLIGKPYGTYHIANAGECSWFHFAQSIFETAHYEPSFVQPLSTEEYGAAAQRPSYSVLSRRTLDQAGIKMRHWHGALQEFIEKEEKGYD